MKTQPAAGALSSNLRSILFVLLSSASFGANDIATKVAAAYLPVPQIIAIRGVGAGIIAFVLICLVHGITQVKKVGQRHVFYRGMLEGLIGPMLITCYALLPVATVSAVMQVGPFLAMIAGIYLFRETVGWRSWGAAFVGFFGVMLIIKPGTGGFQPAALFALFVAVMMVARDIQSRKIGAAAPPFVVSFSTSLYGTILALLLTPLIQPFGFSTWGPWVWPDLFALSMCLASSIFMVAAHTFSFLAFRSGDMSVVAPFRYSYLFFLVIGGMIIFSEYPGWVSVFGMLLIVAAGIYLLHRERLRSKGKAAVMPTSAGR